MPEQEKLREARNIVIEAFGKSFVLYGFPKVVGRIYGVLYFAQQPMDLEEIAGELTESIGIVSSNMQVLESLECVHKVWQEGSPGDCYAAERNFTKIIAEVIKKNMSKEMEITSTAIEKSKEILTQIAASPNEQVREKAQADLAHIKNLENQYKWYDRLVEVFGAGEKLWRKLNLKKDGDTQQ